MQSFNFIPLYWLNSVPCTVYSVQCTVYSVHVVQFVYIFDICLLKIYTCTVEE